MTPESIINIDKAINDLIVFKIGKIPYEVTRSPLTGIPFCTRCFYYKISL